jgi:hypothetical protein
MFRSANQINFVAASSHRGLVTNLHPERVEEHDRIDRSSGRLCQAVTSATMLSVTVLIRSGDTSTPYMSAKNP